MRQYHSGRHLLHIVTVYSLCMLVALCLFQSDAHAGKDLLVPLRPGSAVYQKVIVTSALSLLQPNPGEKGPLLDAFSIFYRLKTDDGQLELTKDGITYWRVGTSQGEPLGYINKTVTARDKDGKQVVGDAVKEWNTRFVIDPQGVATKDRPLIFLHPQKKDEYFRYEGVATTGKDDNRALAFITGEADENESYPVIYYVGKMRSKSANQSTLADVGVDIAFVLEMSDFMKAQWPPPNGPSTLQLLTDSVREIALQAERSDKTRGKVSLALVQYQDTREEQDFVADIASDFTTRANDFEAGLSRLRPKDIKGDWPEDGLAGIDLAIKKLKWRPYTTKHIILIGSMSLQTEQKGRQVSQWGNVTNFITNPDHVWDDGSTFREKSMGWSSTGHNLETICQAARRGGDTDFEGKLADKTLHAILLGKNIRAELSDDDWKAIDQVVNLPDDRLSAFLDAWKGPALFPIKAQMLQREIAERQFQEIAANGIRGGEPIGLYIDAAPTRKGVEDTASAVAAQVEKAFDALESFQVKGASGASVAASDKDKIAKPLVEIARAYEAELAARDAAEAIASPSDTKGYDVGKVKVFVFRREIKDLESTLDRLHTKFAPLTNRAQRANVADILEELKRLIASSATGQVFDENTPLDRIVGDLPLKTPVLSTTAAAIAKMPSEDYSRWVNQLEVAKKRCKDLYESGTWTVQETGMKQSSADKDDLAFGFLEKSRLP